MAAAKINTAAQPSCALMAKKTARLPQIRFNEVMAFGTQKNMLLIRLMLKTDQLWFENRQPCREV